MLADWIKNKKERRLIYLALIISMLILLFGVWTIAHGNNQLNPELREGNHLKSYAVGKGALGRIGIFAAFAMFPLYFIVRTKKITISKGVKKFVGKLLKWVKLFHVPIAVVTFMLITVHGVIMTFFEWHTNAVYITGVITYLLLLPLGILGFLRYKRKGKNWHYYMSFAVIVSMLIHTFI